MKCVAPPALDDQALNDAIDGIASPDVEAHLARCAYCADRLADARSFDTFLNQTFHRWDCPSTLDLSDYDLGLFAPDRRRAIADHLAVCPRCRGELDEFHIVLGSTSMPPVQPRRIRGVVSVPTALLAKPFVPARAAMRGTANAPQMFQANSATIVLQPRTVAADRVLINGQIVDAAGDGRWVNARVDIEQHAAVVAIGFVDDTGSFATGAFGHGTTTITLVPVEGQPVTVEGLAL